MIGIEYILRETRKHQATTNLAGPKPSNAEVDPDSLVAEFNRILDQAADAYRRPREGLSMKWRRRGFGASSTWETFQ